MRLQSAALAATLALVLAACGDDEPATPTTPVTLRFVTDVYSNQPGTAYDTVKGIVIVDGVDTVDYPYGTIENFPRGQHTFEARTNIDYLPSIFTFNVNPRGNVAEVNIDPAGTCRVYQAGGQILDQPFCAPANGPQRNALRWSQYRRLYCPAGDFIEFCTPNPTNDGLGLTWPIDAGASVGNEYVSQAKLLVAATVPNETGGTDAGRNIAMALYRVGDYSPRRRLEVVAGDSSRYSNIAWTDVRHVPVFGFSRGQLDPTDRRLSLFGLEVKATYLLPQQYQDVLVVRYDVRNISNEPDYLRVHPDSRPTGFTLRNIYLTPVIDADIGGAFNSEADDDVATVFPAERLAVAYDRTFAVARQGPTAWNAPWNTAPGIVGLMVLDTDAGAAKGVVYASDTLDYQTTAQEAEAYTILSAGRGGTTLTGCTDFPEAFICAAEAGADVRIGYSVGPIASLAPGERRTLTVAILLAAPTAGTFTSGTAVLPGNTAAELGSTTKASYRAAGQLRALAAQIAPTLRVQEAP